MVIYSHQLASRYPQRRSQPFFKIVDNNVKLRDLINDSRSPQSHIKLIVWTVDAEQEMCRLKRLTVDGLITIYPSMFSGIEC